MPGVAVPAVRIEAHTVELLTVCLLWSCCLLGCVCLDGLALFVGCTLPALRCDRGRIGVLQFKSAASVLGEVTQL